MTWVNRIKDVERSHIKFIKEKGKFNGKGRKKDGWSMGDTAKYLGFSKGKISEDLRIARGLNKFPEIATFKERQDAIAFLRARGEW